MNRAQSTLFPLFGILAFFAALASPVAAAEEPPVIKALYDTFAEVAGDRPSHATLEVADDGTITLTGMSIILAAHQEDGIDVRNEFTAAKAVLRGISELSPGLFKVAFVKLSDANSNAGTPTETFVSSEMPTLEMTGLIIKSPELIKTPFDRLMATQMIASHTRIPTMVVKMEDLAVIIQDMDYRWQGDPVTGMGEWKMAIGSIPIPENFSEMGQGPFSLEALGYDRMELAIEGVSNIGETAGKLDIGFDITIILKEMGSFRMALGAGEIQQELLQALRNFQQSPETTDFNPILAQAQSITINRILFRYDDASLAGRVMDQFLKAEDKTREQLIDELTRTSEAWLAMLNTPDLSADAQAAIRSFLENPGWIQIEAAPAEPVSVTQLMQLIAAPPEIVKLGNVTITSGPPAAQ